MLGDLAIYSGDELRVAVHARGPEGSGFGLTNPIKDPARPRPVLLALQLHPWPRSGHRPSGVGPARDRDPGRRDFFLFRIIFICL